MQGYFKAIYGWILLFFISTFLVSYSFTEKLPDQALSLEIMFFGTPSCEGAANGAVDLTIIGGTPPYIFNWAGTLPDIEDQENLAPGNYEVTVTDALGCTSVRPIVIDISSIDFAPEVFASCGESNGSIQLNTFGGVSPYQAQWSDPSINGLNPEAIDQGSYQVTVTDANGCSGETAVNIGSFPSFNISVTTDANTITVGGQTPFNIQTTGGVLPYDISWSPPNGIQNSDALNSFVGPLESTQYTITVIDGNGCLATDELTILVANPYNAEVGPDTIICTDSIRLTGNLPFDAYGLWEGPEGVTIHQKEEATTLITNLAPGPNKFRWTIESFNQLYYDFDDIVVFVEPTPKARGDKFFTNNYTPIRNLDLLENDLGFAIEDLSIELLNTPRYGELITTNRKGVFHYLPTEDFIGIDSFQYEICNVKCNLCTDAFATIKIRAVTDICEILPTGITPNGDGLNDFLIIDQIAKFPDQHLIVFNRWGDIVYEAKPYQNDWNGVSQKTGAPLTVGTYFYHLRLDLNNGIICSKELTILR